MKQTNKQTNNSIPAPISWQKRPCSQSNVKHVSVSTTVAFKASDRRHHADEFIGNPWVAIFTRRFFIFMRLGSLALPWIAIFARKCDCHAMVNSLAIARIAISTRNLRLSCLRLYGIRGLARTGVTTRRHEVRRRRGRPYRGFCR